MQISRRERNILILAGLVALAFVITSIMPVVQDLYRQRSDSIADVELQIEQERRLFDETVSWRNRRAEVEAQGAELDSQVFTGRTIPVIEANIQSALTRLARESGITVSSTRLAERLETDGWIMVKQEMSFQTSDAASTIEFMRNLNASEPRLWVTEFSLNRARNRFSGSITAVGFAKSEGLLVVQNSTR
jgi:hypothetical protein